MGGVEKKREGWEDDSKARKVAVEKKPGTLTPSRPDKVITGTLPRKEGKKKQNRMAQKRVKGGKETGGGSKKGKEKGGGKKTEKPEPP